MSHLEQIRQRHARDRWNDLGFLTTMLLLMALALIATTSMIAGTPAHHPWSVTVVDPGTQRSL